MGMEESKQGIEELLRPEIMSAWEGTKESIENIKEAFDIPEEVSLLSLVENIVRLAFYDGKMQANKEANDDFKAHMAELIKGLKE